MWGFELGLRRLLAKPRWELTSACQACAKCCEKPTIHVDRWVWIWPTARKLFLAWQRRVNGFELIEAERETRSFVFRCSHFDWETRRCDSYASRPFMCRDYPRVLLDSAWPELFEGCGYGLRDRLGGGLSAALEDTELSPEQREELRRKLRL